jgi:hypothetical protein
MSQHSGPVAPGPIPAEAASPSRTDAVREKAAGAVSAQQRKAVDQLRTVAGGLHEAAGKHIEPGPAADQARQIADRLSAAASWLDDREPGDLLEEVRAQARRRPGLFLAGAAVAGLAIGRLTRRRS